MKKTIIICILFMSFESLGQVLRKDQLNAINARDIKAYGGYSSFRLGKLIDSLILSLINYNSGLGSNELVKANGSNGSSTTGLFSPSAGNLDLGTSSLSGNRTIAALSSTSSNFLNLNTNNASGTSTNMLQFWNYGSGSNKTAVIQTPLNYIRIPSDIEIDRAIIGTPNGFLFPDFSTGNQLVVGTNISPANSSLSPLKIINTGSTISAGFGVGIDFGLQSTPSNANYISSSINSISTNVAAGTQASDMVFKNVIAGSLAEALRITSTKTLLIPDATTNPSSNPTAGFYLYSDASNSSHPTIKLPSGATVDLAVGGGSGTVTSVAASVPPFLSISGSPITTSGTLAITYSGTALPVANGGTNATSAGITAFNNITGYSASGATGTTSTNLVFSASPAFTGTPTLGTLGYSDTGILWSWQSSTNSYNQVIIQNTNSGSTASTNYLVSNDIGTATTHYAEFGKNSSGFTGSGSWQIANGSYLDEASDDLAIGTLANKTLHFFTNSSTTDRLSIDGTGLFTFVAPVPNNSFTSSWTATANNQSALQILGTVTSRNTVGDSWNGFEITQTLTRNAGNPSGQKATGVLINTTFSNSPGVSNILKLQGAGTDYFTFSGTGDSMLNFGASGSGTSPNIRVGGTFFIIDPVAPYSILDLARNGNSVQISSGRLTVNSGGVSTAGGITFFANGNISLTSSGTFGADFSSDSNGRFYIPTSGYIGINNTSPAALLHISNHNTTPLSAASWTTNGIQARFDAATYTDTGATGTRATGVAIGINQPTFTNATSAVITITDAATWYVANAPTSSNTSTGSMTLTRPWSLWIDAGNSRFDGNLDFAQADATNFVFGTSTGTKIGTSTSQKLSFYNSTPIVQPANTVAIDDVLINTGLRASGGSANFTLKVTHSLPENLKNYTVATLPAGTRGDIAYVTDALTPSFLVVVVGGGSTVTPVFFDGTNWVVF